MRGINHLIIIIIIIINFGIGHLNVVGGDEPRPMSEDSVHFTQPLQLGRSELYAFQPLLVAMLKQKLRRVDVHQIRTVMSGSRLQPHTS